MSRRKRQDVAAPEVCEAEVEVLQAEEPAAPPPPAPPPSHMTVRFVRTGVYDGRVWPAGARVRMPRASAERRIREGDAVQAG